MDHDPGPKERERNRVPIAAVAAPAIVAAPASHEHLHYVSEIRDQAADSHYQRSRLLPPLQTDCRQPGSEGEYSPQIVGSPSHTDNSDDSDDDRPREPLSQDPAQDETSPGAPADQLALLSVQHRKEAHDRVSPSRDAERSSPRPSSASRKRFHPADDRPSHRSRSRESPVVRPFRHPQRRVFRRPPVPSHKARPPISHELGPDNRAGTAAPLPINALPKHIFTPVPRDSGYESTESRQNTLPLAPHPPSASHLHHPAPRDPLAPSHPPRYEFGTSGHGTFQAQNAQKPIPPPPSGPSPEFMRGQTVQRHNGLIQLGANSQYPGLILQPDSCPISQEQLAAEVKGIYAGLVMVEAKCINMDATQSANPDSKLGPGQWQALIALHRTLLYEHHDFLMATQHPSASEALRGLAAKYSMPARMWKHGIHAFLEVLRHRRPDSQDYMLAFIYLAYQMMALLFETVPTFTDTWIECLGDLARYRMAIEPEKEPHATWGSVAARWYIMASDRHPAIGRLYHHLGILERPSLRKLCLYAKSLTCVIPFSNARDSLITLCGPIVQDEDAIQSSNQNMEARTVTFYALVYTGRFSPTVDTISADTLALISHPSPKMGDNAAYLAYTNIAALFEFGSATNLLWQVYYHAVNHSVHSTRVTGGLNGVLPWQPELTAVAMTPTLSYGIKFCWNCANELLRRQDDRSFLFSILPFAYVTLVFLHSLFAVRERLLDCGIPLDTFAHITEPAGLSWTGVADYLNSVRQHQPIPSRLPPLAQDGTFPASPSDPGTRPLAEDYLIRGSMWGQFYFVPDWFGGQTEDDGRAIETPDMQTARAERVLWLGLFLAFHTDYLDYDEPTGFSAPADRVIRPSFMTDVRMEAAVPSPPTAFDDRPSGSPRPATKSPSAPVSSSQSEDGFTIIKKSPQAALPPPPPKKQKPDVNTVKVLDDEGILVDTEGEYPAY